MAAFVQHPLKPFGPSHRHAKKSKKTGTSSHGADFDGQKCFTATVRMILNINGHHHDGLRPVKPPTLKTAFLIAYNYTKARNMSVSIINTGTSPTHKSACV